MWASVIFIPRATSDDCGHHRAGGGTSTRRGPARCAPGPTRSRRVVAPAASAATSKYAHQNAHATAMPRTAAAMTPPSTPASAPTPIATIDSPSATMMMRPWRSAKWPATSRQPLVSMNSGPAMSSTSAAAHTASRTSPSKSEPTTRIADADRRAQAEADDGVAQARVVAAGEHEQRDVGGTHGAVRDARASGRDRRTPRARTTT